MKIVDADHTNWRVRDLDRSLRFYRDVLGLEPIGLEAHRRGEHPLVALRVTPTFIVHLRPDPAFEPAPTGGYDHLALVVEGTDPDALAARLAEAGVAVERRSDGVWGARGDGTALYVRDPDGYLIELKLYPIADRPAGRATSHANAAVAAGAAGAEAAGAGAGSANPTRRAAAASRNQSATAGSATDGAEGEAAATRAVVAAWHAALNARDADRLVALSTADVEVGGPRGPARGAEILRDWVERSGIRLEPVRWVVRGNVAVVEQRAWWPNPSPELPEVPSLVATVFVVRDGRVARAVRHDDLAGALADSDLPAEDAIAAVAG